MPRSINPHLNSRQLRKIDIRRDEFLLLTRVRAREKDAERVDDGTPATATLDQILRA